MCLYVSCSAPGVSVRVMDPFTIKPLDEAAVRAHAAAVGGRVVVVEDHYQAGECPRNLVTRCSIAEYAFHNLAV